MIPQNYNRRTNLAMEHNYLIRVIKVLFTLQIIHLNHERPN